MGVGKSPSVVYSADTLVSPLGISRQYTTAANATTACCLYTAALYLYDLHRVHQFQPNFLSARDRLSLYTVSTPLRHLQRLLAFSSISPPPPLLYKRTSHSVAIYQRCLVTPSHSTRADYSYPFVLFTISISLFHSLS